MDATLADLPLRETRRLRLTPLRHEDAEALRLLTDDPAIAGSIHFLPAPFTPADAEALIRCRDSGRDCFLGAWKRGSEAWVGVVGTHLRGENQIEVGYWIGSAFHKQGYATEAALGVIPSCGDGFPSERSSPNAGVPTRRPGGFSKSSVSASQAKRDSGWAGSYGLCERLSLLDPDHSRASGCRATTARSRSASTCV
jgi:hypothetical protein